MDHYHNCSINLKKNDRFQIENANMLLVVKKTNKRKKNMWPSQQRRRYRIIIPSLDTNRKSYDKIISYPISHVTQHWASWGFNFQADNKFIFPNRKEPCTEIFVRRAKIHSPMYIFTIYRRINLTWYSLVPVLIPCVERYPVVCWIAPTNQVFFRSAVRSRALFDLLNTVLQWHSETNHKFNVYRSKSVRKPKNHTRIFLS